MVSVIMGIYNCADTLPQAIDCILKQTYENWELILCDDGSNDNTYQIAKGYAEKYPDKITLLKNEQNVGLNATLNRCLKQAKGCYIARMDGDDLCVPERFEKEIKILENESEIDIVSSDMSYFDELGVYGQIQHPEYPDVSDFPKESPFCHAPCMVKKEAYDAVGGYSVSNRLLRVEDYHLWIKMYEAGFKGKNLHEILYYMRDDKNAHNRRKLKYRLNEAYVKIIAVRKLRLARWMSIYALCPIITGLMPNSLYRIIHRMRLRRE